MSRRILVVDDDPAIRELLREFLTDDATTILEAETGGQALTTVAAEAPDLVLLDMRLPDIDGLEVLTSIRSAAEIPVVVITADSSSSRTIRAMQGGAYDYLVKPLEPETVEHVIDRALEHLRLSEEVRDLQETLTGRDVRERIVGASAAMQTVYKLIGRVAASNAPVLITGETGTGKELVAETIHLNSPRHRGPLIRVNCAALPETLLESELFGHEKGAFTGAVARRKGRFELADGGTIFLDEIGDLNPSTQKKLLRVLQCGEFERVGGSVTIKADARVVAATNKDLDAEVAAGHFREDLYYRLNVIRVDMPPLRERREDIVPLVAHFLDRYRRTPGAPPTKISQEAMELVLAGDWPGNVRQLENTIQRAVVMCSAGIIGPEHLDVGGPPPAPADVDIASLVRQETPLRQVLGQVERRMIAEALRQAGGNRTEAARMLGIYRGMLDEKIKDFGLAEGPEV
jgi:two-component system, NtrC family, response regulator AtoC